MIKPIITVIVLTVFTVFSTPTWADCPGGYSACGSKGQLCCPK